MRMHEVQSSKDKKTFLRIALTINANDPQWIRPLDKDIEEVFDEKKNKFFKRGIAKRWLLLNDNDECIGRVAAFVNRQYKEAQPTGGIGFFECIDDRELAMKLWDLAESWLGEEQCVSIDAPINFGDRDSFWGLLISASNPVSYRESYNPPYYRAWIEARGYAIEIEQSTYDITNATFNYERFSKISDRVMSKGNYRFVYLDYSKLSQFAADFVQIYNEAWAFHDDFEPLTPEVLNKRLKEIKPAMPKEFAVFAYDRDRPIGFFIAILEINQVFKRFKGKMGLWQQLQFLMYRGTITKAKGIVFGVVPDYQNLGIETGLIMKCYQGIKDDKIVDSMELAWIGDFNPKMISMLESLGAKKTKIHHTYRKEISENI
ncbi:MAG: GNAT family N-acetyltransferase [Chitinophagia bacterium]|nr:GNAT family N-acetyltransferase [Chitinophagia bacterium]